MSEKPTRRNEKIVHDPKSSPAAEKPQIVFNQKNDRLGILVGGAVAMGVIALSMLAVWKGQPYGWAVGILAALPLLISSLRSLRAPKDEGQDDGGEEE